MKNFDFNDFLDQAFDKHYKIVYGDEAVSERNTIQMMSHLINVHRENIKKFYSLQRDVFIEFVPVVYPPYAMATADRFGKIEFSIYQWSTIDSRWDVNEYFINLLDLKSHDVDTLFIFVLAHELWHLKQYEDERLELSSKRIAFDGVEYPNYSYNDIHVPWETEANEMAAKYLRSIRSETC